MKKEKHYLKNFGVVFLIFLFAILIAVFINLFVGDYSNELTSGEPANLFCEDKCDKEIVYSNNNSNYDFIRCHCFSEIMQGDGYLFSSRIKTHELFFDQTTLEEMTREEVIRRIRE